MKQLSTLLGLLVVLAASNVYAAPSSDADSSTDSAQTVDETLAEPAPSQQALKCEQEVDPDPSEPSLSCDQWYAVNSSGTVLVHVCPGTAEDEAEAETIGLTKADSAGTNLCSGLGCVHTESGSYTSSCSCKNRVLTCSVTLQVYCASPSGGGACGIE